MAAPGLETLTTTTLNDYLMQAPIPAPLAIRYALQLADALRQAHDQGAVCGGIDPRQVVFSTGAMEFREGLGEGAYRAPEVTGGREPDARSDVFAFGCVLYRLLSGRDAFPAGTAAGEVAPLATVLDGAGPVPIAQFPGLDRVVRQCLSLNPEDRLQRMQKVYLELKMLRVGARKPETPSAALRAEAALRQEIARVEQGLAARIDACDRSLQEVQHAQEGLRTSLASVEIGLNAVRDSAARLEAGLDEAARTAGRVEEALSGQVAAIEQQLQSHSESVEALRTAMSQTDDLLERVVEAFDALQASVVEQSDSRQ